MKKEVEREADFPCSNSNNKSKVNGCRPKNSCCNSRSSKLLPPTSHNSSATLHRSVSSHLLSSARETSSLKSPVSHQSFSSTNNYQNHHQNGPNRLKLQNRSKSMANVNTNHVRSNSSMSTNNKEHIPRLSHHQPCPNHVGGRTFSEIGTQTLPRSKKSTDSDDGSHNNDDAGCAERLKMR